MNELSDNLSRHEVACHCGCGNDSMDHETVEAFQDSCDHFAREFGVDRVIAIIHSGDRCLSHNRSVGSNDRSQHPKSRAIDYHIVGVSVVDLYNYLKSKYHGRYGLGLYKTFVHLDTRSGDAARW